VRPLASPRALSCVELIVGTLIVLGHNVIRVLPNEVPLLVVIGLLSFKLRDGGWSAMGFRRPDSWPRLLGIAIAASVIALLVGELIIGPIAQNFWPSPKMPSMAAHIPGNPRAAFKALLIVWTFAAFGEEIAYRGYLLVRGADLGTRSTPAWWISMLFVSILFGFGHYYKGPTGIVESAFSGLVLGSAYLLAGRNLWASVLTHGFVDTAGVAALFFGLS
jgi:membrane protease YdiL (CAAX protease family)